MDGSVYALFSDGTFKWRFNASGPVISSPAVGNRLGSDETVYAADYRGRLYALSANYGTYRWNFTARLLDMGPKNQFASAEAILSSPVVASSGVVFVGSNDGALYAIHAASGRGGGVTGTVKWRFVTQASVFCRSLSPPSPIPSCLPACPPPLSPTFNLLLCILNHLHAFLTASSHSQPSPRWFRGLSSPRRRLAVLRCTICIRNKTRGTTA